MIEERDDFRASGPLKGGRIAKPKASVIVNAFTLFTLVITVVGYFAGPVPAMLPSPWGNWVALAGMAVILVCGVTSLWILASQFSVQLQRLVDGRLRDSHKEMLLLLEGAREDQVAADSLQSAMTDLSSIAHSLQSSLEQIENAADKRLESRVQVHQALVQLAQVFTVLTGHEVRACIKLVRTTSEERPRRVAVTLARSNTPNADPPERFDLIQQNTDFQAVSIGHSIWHSGAVSSLADYQNSSPNRRYESVLVWGMRYIPSERNSETLWGFLCIDSTEVNAFDVRREVPYGWWFVDAFRSLYRASPDAFTNEVPLRLPGA